MTVTTRDARLLVQLAERPGPLSTLLVHPAGGGLGQYLAVAAHLSRHGDVFGIRAAGLLPGEEPVADVEEMTSTYLGLLDRVPGRPGLLLGWSLGGVIAWELAARMAQDGPAPAVVLIDSFAELPPLTDEEHAGIVERSAGHLDTGIDAARVRAATLAHLRAAAAHRTRSRAAGPCLLLTCAGPGRQRQTTAWRELDDRLTVGELDCGHFEVFAPQHHDRLTTYLDGFLAPLTDTPRETPR
ncbi:thioesterase domain-containing protein [Streptomyces cyaneofuscatus]|uniref:thioesterase domain-containing protein n=1 Tax=Streptomyces cyaneofuscatus TaxID=66883 RepID=UPI00342E74C8